jgi:adenylate cyclase
MGDRLPRSRPTFAAWSNLTVPTARVEQLTKITGDTILLTQQCVDALASQPPGLIDRGVHVLKGKSASVQVFGLGQETDARVDLTT